MLEQMPTEIVERIFTSLAPDPQQWGTSSHARTSFPDIASLSRASRLSRYSRSVALPVLYRNIPYVPIKLLVLLAANPNLSTLVRGISLRSHGHISNQLQRDELQAACRKLALPSEWKERLAEGIALDIDEAVRCLCLALLPNLEVLEVATIGALTAGFLRGFEKSQSSQDEQGFLVCISQALPRLRELRVEPRPGNGKMDMHEVQPLLRAGLKTFRASDIKWNPHPGPYGSDPQASLPERLDLHCLELLNVEISVEGLRDLLMRCPDLRSLILEVHIPRRHFHPLDFNALAPDGSRTLDLERVGAVLRQCGPGIEELSLRIHGIERRYKWSGGWPFPQ